ncbi:hypothetical protein GQ42DRAFT_160437 [Ramicandelaber brevisporus]|nr:hypothetical protein GQ42DRAFT_160437 [Ramicandelaber brevisporus]
MASRYELVYFGGVGAAEVIKAILNYGGADWKLDVVTQETWPALKPSTPFGQVPLLREFDASGNLVLELAQSGAIEAYLGRKFGLYGKTPQEEARIHSIHLSGYYVGDSLSVVDISAFSWSTWAPFAGIETFYAKGETPNLLALIKKVEENPKLKAHLQDFKERFQAQHKARTEQAAAAAAAAAAASSETKSE